MPRLLWVPASSLVVWWSAVSFAADQAELKPLVEREIIGPHLALAQVQAYTEARVPRLPEVRTLAEWERQADRIRQEVLDRVVFRGQAAAWRDAETKVEWLDTIPGGPGYRIKKLRYEALPGLWIPALLYEPDNLAGQVPVMLNVNGHEGQGKAVPYKQIRCINQAKRGMLALNVEWLGMGQLRTDNFMHYRMNQLDLCGTSGLAPFYLAMKRGLDLLLSLENADPQRVGVAGLSGGGWQTIFISSLDTRVTLANPVAGYSSFRTRARFLDDLGDSEQTPVDLALVADYDHLTALLAPRPALLTYNAQDDCCFQADHALPPLLEAARPIYRLYGKEHHLRAHVNEDPGTHNFERDNREAHYHLLVDHFLSGGAAAASGPGGVASFDAVEIRCEAEVKTADELHVELPAENADFHTLALEQIVCLPRQADLPGDKAAAETWQRESRRRLADVVRGKLCRLVALKTGSERMGDCEVAFWRLAIDDAWTVPAVAFAPREAKGTVILVADEGRASAAAEVERLLAAGQRVVAVDPFYLGESRIAEKNFLFALLVAAVGERPLGLQASQLAAIARWLEAELETGPTTLVAVGPRASLASLVAAGLEERAIGGVELVGSLGSLKEVIERNGSVDQTPELFSFGLLEQFDIKQLAALAAPRPVRFPQASDRAKAELAGLKAWYALWGTDFDPLE